MTDPVSEHYTHGALLAAIRDGVQGLGKTPETVTVDDLAPVDEFHIGGRKASEDFLSQLALDPGTHVLDVGCGLGGGARFAASRFGARVTGVDLTPEFVDAGSEICRWVGLDDRIDLQQGSALDLSFCDGVFDAAYMMHVGMNIADKGRLVREVGRVLKPGADFGIYDVMKVGEGPLDFPVPWSATENNSAVGTPDEYRTSFEDAGFIVSVERNRTDFALAFFAELTAAQAAAEGPPPLGLHVLMGETRAEKVRNMISNISNGLIAPVEMIGRKSG